MFDIEDDIEHDDELDHGPPHDDSLNEYTLVDLM